MIGMRAEDAVDLIVAPWLEPGLIRCGAGEGLHHLLQKRMRLGYALVGIQSMCGHFAQRAHG